MRCESCWSDKHILEAGMECRGAGADEVDVKVGGSLADEGLAVRHGDLVGARAEVDEPGEVPRENGL